MFFESTVVAALVVAALVAVMALVALTVVAWFGLEVLRVLASALPVVEEEWGD